MGIDTEFCNLFFVFFQAEDDIRDLVRSRGLGDVYKRQLQFLLCDRYVGARLPQLLGVLRLLKLFLLDAREPCLLYTSDAADERSSVDLGGRRIIKKKTTTTRTLNRLITKHHDSQTRT